LRDKLVDKFAIQLLIMIGILYNALNAKLEHG